jgi:hypothetical protein
MAISSQPLVSNPNASRIPAKPVTILLIKPSSQVAKEFQISEIP